LFKKISENSENLVWQGGATGWYIPRMDLLGLHPLFRPWFQIWPLAESWRWLLIGCPNQWHLDNPITF